MTMSANSTTHDHTGRRIEQVVDHGDGTATRTTWPTAEADPVVETIAVPVEDAGGDGGDVGAEALIASARADVAAATSIAQLRTRTLVLDALRAEHPGVM